MTELANKQNSSVKFRFIFWIAIILMLILSFFGFAIIQKMAILNINVIAAIVLLVFFYGAGIILISKRLIIQPASIVAETNKQLRDLTEKLDTKVKERTQELQVKIEELNESKAALLNTLTDVYQARRKAEEEKNKTFAVINNFVDGLMVLDKNKKLSLINPEAEKMFKLKYENIHQKTLPELALLPELNPIINLLGNNTPEISKQELSLNENLILEISAIPLTLKKEEIGTLIICHDITRDKFIEKMKSDFVTLAAHQLRTPLTATKWIFHSLITDTDKTPEFQKDLFKKGYQSNERMIELVNDLLNIARIEEGRFLYKFELQPLEISIKNAMKNISELSEKRKVKMIFKKPKKTLPLVNVDPEKIGLVLTNLLDNAIKYSPEGKKIAVSIEQVDSNIKCIVKDEGVGIPKNQQNRLFGKFFRATNALKIETDGSGLGLFLCKNIVEKHGGKIGFESKENQGSYFWFTLPAAS